MAQIYGGTLGLIAFLAIVMRGLVGGSPASATLLTASLSLPVFFVLGCVIGWIADRTIQESIRAKIESSIHSESEVAATPSAASGG